MKFEVFSDLPGKTQTKIRKIQAKPEGERGASEVAFLLALAPYLTNEVLSVDANGLILKARGENVPNGYEGFAKGALFIEMGAEGNGLYVNVGDETSADFDLVDQASTANIEDGAVTTAKLADGAVTPEKIVNGAVGLGIADEDTPVNSEIASGTITSTANGVPTEDDTITIGEVTYTFKDTFSSEPTVPYEVKIGADGETTLNNLRKAINGTGTEGVEYSEGTEENPDVEAPDAAVFEDPDYVLTVSAKVGGVGGNDIVLTESADNITVSGTGKLTGGVDGTPGAKGSLMFDEDYLYVAVQENTKENAVWKKVEWTSE